MDSNHRSREATDLQSVPFNHSGTYPKLFHEAAYIHYGFQKINGGPIWT